MASTSASKTEYLSFDQGARLIRDIKCSTDILVIANLAFNSPETVRSADIDKISQSKPDFVELNLKPLANVELYKSFLKDGVLPYEERLAKTIETACAIISDLSSQLSVPLIVKTTTELADPTITERFKAKGARAITVSNSLETVEPRLVSNKQKNLFMAALSGNSLKSLTFRSIALNFSRGTLPIVASGGLLDAQDLYYAILLGAGATELVTAILTKPRTDWRKEMQRLAELIKENGLRNINEARGSLASLVLQKKVIGTHVFSIDKQACKQCGSCRLLCEYNAIEESSAGYTIVRSRCTGCGLCVAACEKNAVKEVPTDGYIN